MSRKIDGNNKKTLIDQLSGHLVISFNTREMVHCWKLAIENLYEDVLGVQIRDFRCVLSMFKR